MTAHSSDDNKSRDVAIFDLDHTISKQDTYLNFLLSFLRTHPWRVWRCIFLPLAVLIHKLKFRDNSWLKARFLKAIVGGVERQRLKRFMERFVVDLLSNGCYADALACIRMHRKKQDFLILASASFDFYVQDLANQLGFDKVICTRADWDANDRLTGRIAGNNCYGEFKKAATAKVLDASGLKGKVTVYSDHHSDLPVFSLADRAIAVNPTGKLIKLAAVNQIAIEKWQ